MEANCPRLQVVLEDLGRPARLTVVMVFVDVMHMPRRLLLFVLLGAMLTKAFLIATEFMDLKHERLVVGLAIAFSVLFFGAFLFAFIAPDGFMVFHGGR